MSDIIIWTVASLTVLGLLLAVILYYVAQKFKVEENPKIGEVDSVLPQANCGGCGFAGCHAFAESCVKQGSLEGHFCTVGGNAVMKLVAEKMGVEAVEQAPQVAVVRCQGSPDKRKKTNDYGGASSCKVKASLYTGDTGCKYGCLGEGDCVDACNFDAIHMNPQTGLPEVTEENCTACGACVKACPLDIIELRNKGPKGRRVYVACKNEDKGGVARKACSIACIGCGLCEKACKFGAITIVNNLAYVDFNKCKLCRQCVVVCPTGAMTAVNFPTPLPKKKETKKAPKASEITKPVVPPINDAAKTEAAKPIAVKSNIATDNSAKVQAKKELKTEKKVEE